MRRVLYFVVVTILIAGCRNDTPVPPATSTSAINGGKSSAEQIRDADISILFVGNSHTGMHNLPRLVCEMIRHRHPEKKVYSHYIPVVFLEDAGRSSRIADEIATHPWKHVVLQAQKISVSGQFDYSRKEGLDLAKKAKAKGIAVLFYPEWGVAGVVGDGERQEKVYREMAEEAAVAVAPIATAWDMALAKRPELQLHDMDGNHQSELGAFLTACVLYARLTGESPTALATFPYPKAEEADRQFLADIAAKTIAQGKTEPRTN